jgi:hypothetical protein
MIKHAIKARYQKVYDKITEDDDFMHLKDEYTAEDLEEEIESQLKNGWRLSDLKVSSTSSASIEGEGLVKCCNTIYGDSRAMTGLPIEFHPTCPFPNCCYFSPKAVRIVEHYKREHKDEMPRKLARSNSTVRAYMDSKYGARWRVPRATQRFTHEKNGGLFPTMVRVKAAGAESYHRNRTDQILERQRTARLQEIVADGAIYKGIRIVELGNMVGGNADDPFIRDPRVLKKFQMIIDQLKFVRPSAMNHIERCSHVVTMTLQTIEEAISLQMKQNITLDRVVQYWWVVG